MKARERQDLKKNELADYLEHLRLFFEQHGSKILSIALVALIVVVAGIYFIHNREVARTQAWEQLLSIRSGRNAGFKPDDLRTLAQTTSDRQAAAVAWKELGDMLSTENMMGDQSAKPKDAPAQARQAYETVINQYPEFPLIVAGSKMGLAILLENSGNWDKARQTYKDLSADKSIAGTGIPEIATGRLAMLDTLEKSAKTPLAPSKSATTKAKISKKS
jgi:hypothetical protein